MDAQVLVVGDVMLDRYWQADADRISPEAPVPVASVNATHERLGGAANVAQNINALGASATLIAVTGKDEDGRILTNLLRHQAIDTRFIIDDALRTTAKIRVVSRNQQLMRLDFDGCAHACEEAVLRAFSAGIENASIVILSDYGKGVLADPEAMIATARKYARPVIVDPKGTDFAKYRHATVITPNFSEFCAVVGECRSEQEIYHKARQLCRQFGFQALLITRSEKGMTLVKRAGRASHFAAHMREVYDVTGAGDTVISAFALSLVADNDFEKAAHAANVAAGIVVGKFGAATVSAEELTRGLFDHARPATKLVSQELLVKRMQDARAKNKTVVFTNGCFDVLHKGHACLLRQAATYGDILIVALNSDASVRRLKGSDRPINNLQDRAEMLSHFASVDCVVAFDEDTPEALIKALRPNVLVKGGDYSAEQIAGAEYVRRNGGQVKTVTLVAGYSTSNIISSITDKH